MKILTVSLCCYPSCAMAKKGFAYTNNFPNTKKMMLKGPAETDVSGLKKYPNYEVEVSHLQAGIPPASTNPSWQFKKHICFIRILNKIQIGISSKHTHPVVFQWSLSCINSNYCSACIFFFHIDWKYWCHILTKSNRASCNGSLRATADILLISMGLGTGPWSFNPTLQCAFPSSSLPYLLSPLLSSLLTVFGSGLVRAEAAGNTKRIQGTIVKVLQTCWVGFPKGRLCSPGSLLAFPHPCSYLVGPAAKG